MRQAPSELATSDESVASSSPLPYGVDAGGGVTTSPARDEDGEARHPASETGDANSPAEAVSAPAVRGNSESPARYANVGSITLGVAASICLVLGATQGFIPIFLIEGVAFGGLAWLCAAKWHLSQSLYAIVLVTSLLLAVMVGVTLDQDSFGPRYRYLSQGTTQFRVDEKAGRTDRLGNSGWYPVAYDKGAQEIPELGALFAINLTKGEWSSALGGQICFTISNSANSGYVVDRITTEVKTQTGSSTATDNKSAQGKDYSVYGQNPVDQMIVLKSYGGGFISPGQEALACATAPRALSAGETWSSTDEHIYGWKQ